MTKWAGPALVFLDSVDSALGQGAKEDGSGTQTPSLGAEGRFGPDKPHRRMGNDGPSLSHRWDGPPVRLRRRKACLPLPYPMLRILLLGAPPWSYFELRRLPLFTTNQTMTAVSAEEGSLSSKRSWNLKAESLFIYLNAGTAESAFGRTRLEVRSASF